MKSLAVTPLIAVLFLMIATPLPCRGGDASLAGAEEAAKAYLQAYFDREPEQVAALMHPSLLAETKRLIVAEYQVAEESGTLPAFMSTLGLEGDPTQIVTLEPGELFVRLVIADYEAMGDAQLAALDDIRIEATDPRFLEPDIARVTLRILGPTPTGYREEIEVIDLALHEGRWLVLGDSPEP